MKKFVTLFIAGAFMMSIDLNAQTTVPATGSDNKKATKDVPSKVPAKKETVSVPIKKVASKKHKDSLVKPVEKKTITAPSKK